MFLGRNSGIHWIEVSGLALSQTTRESGSLKYKWILCIFKARSLFSNRENEKNHEQPQSVVPVCGRDLFQGQSYQTTMPCIWFIRPNIVRLVLLSAFYEYSSLLRRTLVIIYRCFERELRFHLQDHRGQELRSFETLVNISQSTRSHILGDLNSD